MKKLYVRKKVVTEYFQVNRNSLARLRDIQSIASDVIGQPVTVSAVLSRALVALLDEWQVRKRQGDIDEFIATERQRLYDAARPDEE